MTRPRASTSAWRRLPGWLRASFAFRLDQGAEETEAKLRTMRGRSRKRWRLERSLRQDRALLALLLSVDPDLARHLARYERSVRGPQAGRT
jgi:hypothetical protein